MEELPGLSGGFLAKSLFAWMSAAAGPLSIMGLRDALNYALVRVRGQSARRTLDKPDRSLWTKT